MQKRNEVDCGEYASLSINAWMWNHLGGEKQTSDGCSFTGPSSAAGTDYSMTKLQELASSASDISTPRPERSGSVPSCNNTIANQIKNWDSQTEQTTPMRCTDLLSHAVDSRDAPQRDFYRKSRTLNEWLTGPNPQYQTHVDEPLDLSIKGPVSEIGSKFNGRDTVGLRPPLHLPIFDSMRFRLNSWRVANFPQSHVDPDYLQILRNFYYHAFRMASREREVNGQICPVSLHPSLARIHQAATVRDKTAPADNSLAYPHKLHRTRRLTNYWPVAFNKPSYSAERPEFKLPLQPLPAPPPLPPKSTMGVEEQSETKSARRPYTEAELAAAVRAICFDRLGTRRAASVYGIPRSTLRNKICKLNELKKREEERQGGKSIVMADFLHSLIQSHRESTTSNANWTNGRSHQPSQMKEPGSGIQRPFAVDRTFDRDREHLFTTATHVASIFQVNCRKSYGSRNLHDLRYTLRSMTSSRLRGNGGGVGVGRLGRFGPQRKRTDSRYGGKSEPEMPLCRENGYDQQEVNGEDSCQSQYHSISELSSPGRNLPAPSRFMSSSSSAFDRVNHRGYPESPTTAHDSKLTLQKSNDAL